MPSKPAALLGAAGPIRQASGSRKARDDTHDGHDGNGVGGIDVEAEGADHSGLQCMRRESAD
jgi:hypothetical protein